MTKTKRKYSLILLILGTLFSLQLQAHETHCEDTKLGAIMSQVKKSFKKLKKSVDKEDFQTISKWNNSLLDLTEQANDKIPLKKKMHPELNISQYQEGLKKMKAFLLEISNEIKAHDSESIETILEKLNKLKKKSHKQFRLECD